MLRKPLDKALRRLGRPGVVAIGIALFAAMGWLSAVAPLESRRESAEKRLAELQSAARPGTHARGQGDTGLERFYAFFRGHSAADRLEAVHALAREAGLQLKQGSYRFSAGQGERLARYEMTLPVRGSYAQIRRFLARLLNEVPVASLDQVAFEKKRADDPHVEAQLRLTVFVELGTPELEHSKP